MIEQPTRRFFLRGLVAAPAVILTNHLMPVKPIALGLYYPYVPLILTNAHSPGIEPFYSYYNPSRIAKEILSVQPMDTRLLSHLMEALENVNN